MVHVHVCHAATGVRVRPANWIFNYFGVTAGVVVDDMVHVRLCI
jgi:hypothetical protein